MTDLEFWDRRVRMFKVFTLNGIWMNCNSGWVGPYPGTEELRRDK